MEQQDELLHQLAIKEKLLERMRSQYQGGCKCDEHKALSLRTFRNGSHHVVYQCTNCGNQVGNALSKNELAKRELAGLRQFDDAIQASYSSRVRERSERLALIYSDIEQIRRELFGFRDSRAELELQRQVEEAHKLEFVNGVKLALDRLEDAFGPLITRSCINELLDERIRLERESKKASAERFSSEGELKEWFKQTFHEDFHIFEECVGIHLIEDRPVRIDFVLRPKQHVIDEGFIDEPFGVEVKYLNPDKGFEKKAGQTVWQTISYYGSSFDTGRGPERLSFCQIFSNISFQEEYDLLKTSFKRREHDQILWRGMMSVANHADVGRLSIVGTKNNLIGWSLRLTGASYFSCSLREGKKSYRLHNSNIISKRRIGNCA